MYRCLVATLFANFCVLETSSYCCQVGCTAEHYYPDDSLYEMKILGVLAIVQVMCFRKKIKLLSVYPIYPLLVLGQLPFILLTISCSDKCHVSVGKYHSILLQYI